MLLLLQLTVSVTSAGEDPKSILEKSFYACKDLRGGNFRMAYSNKLFNEKQAVSSSSICGFLRVPGDSASPFKFFVQLGNGDGTLCMSNDLVQLQSRDSTGVIYSRSNNQSMYRGAFQSEGLFPPFFQPGAVFSLDRLEQTTFIIRLKGETKALGKPCYQIQVIDLIRASQPDGQRQEKLFLIDKETYLPVSYEEKSIARLNTDSLIKENKYELKELDLVSPHDSVFTYKRIPSSFVLRNVLESVHHHHLKTGKPVPPFKGKLVGGDSLFSETLKGKKTLVCFFSRTSYPSLKSLATLKQLQNQNPGFEIIIAGIDIAENDMLDILKRRNITVKAMARAQNIADAFFITAAPAFIFIDEGGLVKKIVKGFGDGTGKMLQDF